MKKSNCLKLHLLVFGVLYYSSKNKSGMRAMLTKLHGVDGRTSFSRKLVGKLVGKL